MRNAPFAWLTWGVVIMVLNQAPPKSELGRFLHRAYAGMQYFDWATRPAT